MAQVGKNTSTPLNLQIGAATEMMKSFLALLRTRRAVALIYAFAFAFVAFTAFVAFVNNPTTSSPPAAFGDGSRFSSLFAYFFPNSTAQPPQTKTNNVTDSISDDETLKSSKNPTVVQAPPQVNNQSHVDSSGAANHTLMPIAKPPSTTAANGSANVGVSVIGEGMRSNYTTSLLKKKQQSSSLVSNVSASDGPKKQMSVEETLVNCNFYEGSWVRDESYPLYKPGSCSLIDEQFNCIANGRPDTDYQKLRWKPHGCTLPRLDAKRMLKMLKGKRLAFVGDSLNRNMWESLVCILKNSVKDQKKVYEAHGRHRFRTAEASYSFVFKDYDLSVEFFVSPFLVREWEIQEKDGHKKETLRLDLMGESAAKYKGADIIIFNTGHWWTHEKTSKGEDYYQEGNHVYNKLHVKEAFRKAITTWARWVDSYVNPLKTIVFFRGYSESHFSGGRWNSGGQCHNETEPIKNEKFLASYPYKMRALETVLHGMKTSVNYLNITRITDYRKDAHPSIYRKRKYSEEENKSALRYQDCSHWCLPGVPDTWNELLYAELLVKEYQRQEPQS
ncbi:unnamed protein product [Rhodiola kirilowii]